MERKVFQAAQEGNVISLLTILQEDPLIFDRILVNCLSETPLHVAAMLGHVNVVVEIVRKKPQLVRELNLNKSTPLHLASARGFIDVVRALILVDPEMCLSPDEDGRNPLHLAAMKGKVNVLKELLQAKPDAARATVHRGETFLHVCVIHNQFEALKLLVDMISDTDFFNAKDYNGNTILHMAVANKQTKIINYLLSNTSVEVNAVNLYGLTAMDILIQSPREVKDLDIRESLSRAGAISAKDSPLCSTQGANPSGQKNNFEDSVKQQQDWLERQRNSLMIVASLIATMAFQAGVNPSGGFWQETKTIDSVDRGGSIVAQKAGYSIWATNDPIGFDHFVMYNTVGFAASLSIILLLISGFPLRRKVYVWILTVIMWIAIIALAITYNVSIIEISKYALVAERQRYAGWVLFVWFILVGLLLLRHLVRFIKEIIKAVSKFLRRKRMDLDS